MEEIWKPIKGYEGIYDISNYGRVKSLKRKTNNQTGKEDLILVAHLDKDKYPTTVISKNGKSKTYRIHRLVWEAFGEGDRDGMNIQIDHIDNDRSNPRIDNLQLLDHRANTCKARQRNRKTDLPIGVYLADRGKPYKVSITQNGVRKYLGRYNSPEEAGEVYQKALREIQCQKEK